MDFFSVGKKKAKMGSRQFWDVNFADIRTKKFFLNLANKDIDQTLSPVLKDQTPSDKTEEQSNTFRTRVINIRKSVLEIYYSRPEEKSLRTAAEELANMLKWRQGIDDFGISQKKLKKIEEKNTPSIPPDITL